MTWVIWRQYRVTAAIAGAILAAFAVLFLVTGLHMAAQWHAALTSCARTDSCDNLSNNLLLGSSPMKAVATLTIAVPVLFGLFWGSPAVARERETGTIQFAWSQSVTRRRWLTAKTCWLLLAGALFGGAVGGIVTWWYSPVNALNGQQFTQGTFDIQGIAPIGYSVFAVALGITAGTLIGRTLPALAVTIGVFLALRLSITDWVRAHYMTPVTTVYSMLQSFTPKGAYWQIAQGTVLPNGQRTTSLVVGPMGISQTFGGLSIPAACGGPNPPGQPSDVAACMGHLGYHSFFTYQPGYRFWPFQFIETGIFVALAAVLIAVTFAVVRRKDA